MFAIREDRDYVIDEDFMKAARKIRDTKKLESKLDYQKIWLIVFDSVGYGYCLFLGEVWK